MEKIGSSAPPLTAPSNPMLTLLNRTMVVSGDRPCVTGTIDHDGPGLCICSHGKNAVILSRELDAALMRA